MESKSARASSGRISALAPLASANLPEMIADRIIEAIARRHLLPEQRLIETELSEQLSVSRIPLREAIRVLQTQGIVIATPRRGVRVAEFGVLWARQLCDMRVMLERSASHAAAARLRADSEMRARLTAALRNLERAAERDDWYGLRVADVAFHTTVYDTADNPLVRTLWSGLGRHVLLLLSSGSRRGIDPIRVVSEHRMLRQALLQGSPADIDATVTHHVGRDRELIGTAGSQGKKRTLPISRAGAAH